MSIFAIRLVRRSISRTLSRYSSRVTLSAAPNWFWKVFVRSRMRSRRLSDSRAFKTRSFGVVEPNKELKTFFGLYSIGSGVLAVSYTHLRAHETPEHLVCRLLLEKK